MNNNKRSTDYAPAERASEGQINLEADLLIALPLLGQLLDSIPDIVLILNEQRQIVFANQIRPLLMLSTLQIGGEYMAYVQGKLSNVFTQMKLFAGVGPPLFVKIEEIVRVRVKLN